MAFENCGSLYLSNSHFLSDVTRTRAHVLTNMSRWFGLSVLPRGTETYNKQNKRFPVFISQNET